MSLSNRWKKLLFIAFVFLFPLEVWSNVPSKAVEIQIEESVSVSGKNIVLGDVATIYSKNIHVFQALSNLVITSFSGEEAERTIPVAYLRSRIQEVLPKGVEFAVRAPAKIKFRKEILGVTGEMLAQEILRKATDEGKIPSWAEVKIESLSALDSLKFARIQDLQIAPAAEMPRWRGEQSFKVTRADSKELVWLKFNIRWFGKALVAKRAVSPWSAIRAEDFEWQRIELTQVRDEPVNTPEEFASLLGKAKAKRLVAEGAPLTRATLERIPDAKMGQALKVVFISESGIRVAADGAILNPLSVGEEGRAKLRNSKKIVTGRLVSEGVMEVSL
jgi:flagella basal body P-ring formation protein FlgA